MKKLLSLAAALVVVAFAAAAAPLGQVTEGFQTTDGQFFATQAEAQAHQDALNLRQEIKEFLVSRGYSASLTQTTNLLVDFKDTIDAIYAGGDFEPPAPPAEEPAAE